MRKAIDLNEELVEVRLDKYNLTEDLRSLRLVVKELKTSPYKQILASSIVIFERTRIKSHKLYIKLKQRLSALWDKVKKLYNEKKKSRA